MALVSGSTDFEMYYNNSSSATTCTSPTIPILFNYQDEEKLKREKLERNQKLRLDVNRKMKFRKKGKW